MAMQFRLMIASNVLLFVVSGAVGAPSAPNTAAAPAAVPSEQAAPAPAAPAEIKGSYVDFEIKATPPTVFSPADERPDRSDLNQYKRGLAAEIKSGFVINKALDNPVVQALPLAKQHGGDAAKWLQDQIIVKFPGDANIMEIGMKSNDPRQAEVIVQAVADAFQHEIIERERTEKLQRRDQLDKKYRAYKSLVLEKTRELFELDKMEPSTAASTRLHQKTARLERFTEEADRAEIQAELQIARGKHKLAGLAATSAEYKAIQAEIDLAEVDRTFWHDKSASLSKQIDETDEKIQSARRFNGDADQLKTDIAKLQTVVDEMGDTLTKWTIELDAAPRIRMLGPHSD